MIMRKLVLISLLVFSFCNRVSAEQIALEITEIDTDALVINAEFANGRRIDEILYSKDLFHNEWFFVFHPHKSEKQSQASSDKGFRSLSVDEFVDLIDAILSGVSSRDYIGDVIIDLDFKTVSGVWNESVLAIRHAAKSNTGVVGVHRPTWDAVMNVLNQSDVVVKTCEVVKKYSYSCSDDRTWIVEIGFRSEYRGKDWEEIVNATDAGLIEDARFQIITVQSTTTK